MVSIIDAAKKQLNLGNSELSLKLGHHGNYISRVLHQENPTVEQITKVVDKVNALIGEQKLPCGNPLPEFKHTPIADAVMVSKDEYESLKKELDHKNQVLDKRNDLYQKLELECKDKDDAIKLQLENVASKILAINELESQLKTTQQKFVDVVDQKNGEIDKLVNYNNHVTNQYQGKREQVVQLSEKIKKKENVYMLVIVILLIASTIDFAS
jgi:DNA repair exonuclease SbcCD ATPase subunit